MMAALHNHAQCGCQMSAKGQEADISIGEGVPVSDSQTNKRLGSIVLRVGTAHVSTK